MSQPMYYAMYTGVPPARTGTSHATIAPYGTFRTGSGAVQLAIQNQREWSRLCTRVLDRPDLLVDSRFATNADRVYHRDELTTEIEMAMKPLDTDETLQRLDAAQIANGSFNSVLDLLDHPQLGQTGRWTEIATPGGPVRALTPPTVSDGYDALMGAVPDVGEHTEALLGELGFDNSTVAAWRSAGTI
jgi:itaconate CoA-transferase